MFNPITASQEIKDAFTDYITTTFDFADPDYADELKKSIQESGAVAKGPYLEVSGSYESGESIAELIAEHKAIQGDRQKHKANQVQCLWIWTPAQILFGRRSCNVRTWNKAI